MAVDSQSGNALQPSIELSAVQRASCFGQYPAAKFRFRRPERGPGGLPMASITIHSRLNDFKLVAQITQVTAAGICAAADFERMPMYGGLEAMAQLVALHVRHCLDFERHAFLLKVIQCRWTNQNDLEGRYRLSADLRSQSSNTFAYQANAQGPDGEMLSADLLIGTKSYDCEFKEDVLKTHYKEIFRKLQLCS